MDWKQFIASLIQNLAWPLSTLLMFFLVRDQVGKLLGKLGSLKYKDLELDFSKVKAKAEQAVKEDEEEKKGSEIVEDSESRQVFNSLEEQIFESIESSPSSAILLSWSYVEAALSSAVKRMTVGHTPSSPLHSIQALEKCGELSKQQVELAHDLRTLRNRIAHDSSTSLSIREEQALDYAETAIELSKYLNTLNRKRKVFMLPSGEWTRLPKDYVAPSSRTASYWNYSCIDLAGTDLTAGAGGWKNGDGGFEYFGIDIEQTRKNSSAVVTELLIDLKYVSDEILEMPARNFVEYDELTKVVKFDLGKSIFEYQLK